MLGVIAATLDASAAIAAGSFATGTTGTSTTGNLVGSALQGIASGLSNLFTGASEGVPLTQIRNVNMRLPEILSIPTIPTTTISEIDTYIADNEDIIIGADVAGDATKTLNYLKDVVETSKKVRTLLDTISEVKSFTWEYYTQTGLVKQNAVTTTMNDGRKWEYGDQISDIPSWVMTANQAMEDLGFIGLFYKHFQPSNFLAYGANISIVQWTGVATDDHIKEIIDGLTKTFNTVDNTLESLKGINETNIANILIDIPNTIGNVGVINLNDLLNPPRTITEEQEETIAPNGVVLDGIRVRNASVVRTKTETTKGRKGRKLRRQKRKKKRNNKKKKIPDYIKKIWVDVSRNSEWIKTLTFEFPKKTLYNTDSRGTLTFTLKDGHVIRKVRVNRGTFSAIVMWVYRQHKGAGYRYWSQFNKARIVNRNVYSWSLPRINANDRRIGINRELQNKKVHYK